MQTVSGKSLLDFSGWKIWESEEGGCKRVLWGKAGIPVVTVVLYGLHYLLARCTTHSEGVKDKAALTFSFPFFLTLLHVRQLQFM